MVEEFKPGDRVVLQKGHPWAGEIGTLIEYGPYGPSVMGFVGWKIKLPHCECYAHESKIKKA